MADKGGAAQISTAMRMLAEIIAGRLPCRRPLPILISTKVVLYVTGSAERQQQGVEKDEAVGRAVRLR